MVEQSDGHINTDSKDLIFVSTHPTSPINMDLPAAQLVLETVISTHENSFTESSDFTRAGDFTSDQIRRALEIVSLDTLLINGGGGVFLNSRRITKQTPHGVLELAVYGRWSKDTNRYDPGSVYMSLLKDGRYSLESELPLTQGVNWNRNNLVRFSDKRGESKYVSMERMSEGASIDGFRHIWRGMRWLSANMLGWDKEFRFPEDLDVSA